MVRKELEAILVRLEEQESREIEVAMDRLDRKEKEVQQGNNVMLARVVQKVNRAREDLSVQ